MTLPASFPLSMSQIATELGLSLPLSINHPWVLALAGKTVPPISFSDLFGAAASYSGNLTIGPGPITGAGFSAPFFGGVFSGFSQGKANPTAPDYLTVSFSSAPVWSGNITITNNTTGAFAVVTKVNATTWQILNADPNICENRSGHTDNFTITHS